MKDQITFANKKGINDSDRIAAECLKEIAKLLNDKQVKINGKLCNVKVISKEPKIKLMFDILEPCESLDYIEFNIEKTGWGMNLIKENNHE